MKPIHWVLGGVGVLALCCVGSCGVALLAGAAEGAAGGQASAIPSSPSTPSAPSGGFEGEWSYGALTSMNDFRNALTGDYSPPIGSAIGYVFKSGGECEQYAVIPTATYSCKSFTVVGHADCHWRLAGDQLTVDWGEGTQFFKKCGGDETTGSTEPQTRTYTVVLNGDALSLTDSSGTTPFRRLR